MTAGMMPNNESAASRSLTPAEREALARYTGPVRIIPRGVSGLPPEDYGKPFSMRAQIKLSFDIGKLIKAGVERRNAERRAGLPPLRELPGEAMNAAIARMVGEGHTKADIARFYGLSRAAITQRLRKTAE